MGDISRGFCISIKNFGRIIECWEKYGRKKVFYVEELKYENNRINEGKYVFHDIRSLKNREESLIWHLLQIAN